jgi:hypothetical protein
LSSDILITSDFKVFEGGLTDRCPPVLIDRRFDFVSTLFDEVGVGDDDGVVDIDGSCVRHGDVMTVDNDRSRRDGGGRPVDDISTWEWTR